MTPSAETPAPVVSGSAATDGRLVIEGEQGPETVQLTKSPMVMGRLGDIRLSDSRISRRHAQIVIEGGKYFVEDLGSSNGTFVNDTRIQARCLLKTGDVIRIGPFRMVVVLEEQDTDANDEVSTAVRAVEGALHARNRPGTDLTERIVPVRRPAPHERTRPTVQADPKAVRSRDATADDIRSTGVLLVRLGDETIEVPVDRPVELDHALSLGGLNVTGPAGTVLFRAGRYWLETKPERDAILVNGRPVTGAIKLNPGDQLSIGPVELELQVVE